ncbi:ABC transporter substrate-binding protein [Paenibacillus sp. GCM10012306]|uniref:ABC transporter substrate-binding protein n=1 Tax=Paenibacillus sp. GCM10012306 TaxID=3317342 RepID=UPI00360CB33E
MYNQTTSHYLCMAESLNPAFRLHEPLPVSIEELSEILCCTSRNVKFILRKLEEKGLIQWQPGRGRGNMSQLTFLQSKEEILENSFQELLGKGKIKEATLVLGNATGNEPLKIRLLDELNKHLGFQSEPESTSGQDVLRMVRNRALDKLDPAFVYSAFECYLLSQICSTLVIYDTVNDCFLPGLAHMWESSEDHTHWVFYLRKGVRFHHGRVMTAKDVIGSLDRLRNLHSPTLWFFRDIISAETKGEHCVHFHLNRPNLFILHLFSNIHMSIVPYDVEFSTEFVGTGPYRVKELNENVLVLEAFDQYYGLRALLDRVEIWFVLHDVAPERQYELPDQLLKAHDARNDNNNRIDYPALGCRYILFNFHKEGIHHKLKFRQALRLIYNRTAMIKELGGSRLTPADSLLPWNSKERNWENTADSTEQIKELLQACGYGGEAITAAFMSKKEEVEEAQWLQRRCAEVGITLKFHPLKKHNAQEVLQHADLILGEEILEEDWQWGMITYFKNESNYLRILLLKSQCDVIDRSLEDFAQQNEADRARLLNQAESILRDNAWVLYGCHLNKRALFDQSLYGLHTSTFGFLDLSKLWIKSPFQGVVPTPHSNRRMSV